ncbi:MAG: iron-containing alcohol dehydrogenase [Clostridia bacterium]
MENFEFYTPTKIYFGRDTHKKVGEIIAGYGFHKILLHYGGGSIHRSGLYNAIVTSLREHDIAWVELGGVSPNPKLSLAKQGMELCRAENVEFILAAGGGSVLDSAKCIADGAANPDVETWEFFDMKREPQGALPVGAILTLAASGSEMSASCVITNEEGWFKRGFNSPYHRPLFSILNPELTFTVSPFQTGCGIVDIMMHTMERYFTLSENVDLTDHLAEGLLKSVIAAGKRAIDNPRDYEARATLMWAGSLSHNDLTGAGRQVFMGVHQMEHELSGMYDFVAHGAGLSVLFPAWAKFQYPYATQRFCQFAVRVWNLEMDYEHPEETAKAGIAATEAFFASLGMPVRLRELGIGAEKLEEMAEKCTFFGKRILPDYKPLGKAEIMEIYRLALG